MDRHELPTGLDLQNMTGQQLQDIPANVCKAKAIALMLQAEAPGEGYRRQGLHERATIWAQIATAAAISEQNTTTRPDLAALRTD